MAFKKVERSYNSTPNGWRLATFEEVQDALEMIKKENILNKWDRVRLLDGWITGSGYNFEMGNDFKGCLGYMLLVQTKASGDAYANVHLTEQGKEVALFLCVDDWNYEVVYWLLNSWSNSEIVNVGDVTGGNLPFSNVSKFEEMNKMMGHVARRLGEEAGQALEKSEKKAKYTGADSVRKLLSGMINVVTEDNDIVRLTSRAMWMFRDYGGEEYCLPDSVKKRYVAEAFWSFVCDSFAGYVVEVCALTSLFDIRNMLTESTGGQADNLTIATSILLYLSDYRSAIIHEPLAHHCLNSCAAKIILYAAKKAAGDPQKFSEILKNNAMWRCYDDDTGNYAVLDKLLTIAVESKHNNNEEGEKITVPIVNMLLQCGAKPGRSYAICKDKNKTALHAVANIRNKAVGIEVAEAILSKCDEQSISEFVNATDESGRTALHRASEKGNADICQLLVDCGASMTAQDKKGKTALHYALQKEQDKKGETALHCALQKEVDEVIDMLLQSPDVSESLGLKDNRGYTPLDAAVSNIVLDVAGGNMLIDVSVRNILSDDLGVRKRKCELIEKLLSKSSEKSKASFNRVDPSQFLRTSLQCGFVNIAVKLFENGIRLPAGDCDKDGKTALHLAAMCDNESDALEIISLLIAGLEPSDLENMLAKRDNSGRTVLHEAALNGHVELCEGLLLLNPNVIYIKDREGRNPLYDVVQGEYKNRESPYRAYNPDYKRSLSMQLLKAYLKNDMPGDDLMDSSGRTLLHIVASQGKAEFVEGLLSRDEIKKKLLSKADIRWQTALHMAAKRGEIDIVKSLLKHGADPLRERDCDGRTALHYAAQAEIENKMELADVLLEECKSQEEKLLLLFASAIGVGTADRDLGKDDPLRRFLSTKREKTNKDDKLRKKFKGNLLKMAAFLGDIEMSKDLIAGGDYKIEDLRDWDQNDRLEVKRVLQHIEKIREQGNDKPAIADSLGRLDYAQGVAALFLNPYIEPPIAVGITGSWGAEKSSVMLQTERILLTTAAQMSLSQSSELSNSKEYDLEKFLNEYDLKNRKIFKALAAIDNNKMLKRNAMGEKADPLSKEIVPAFLTVQYNAWKYRNYTEALAGIAVEITKELEGIMTTPQWLSTCCRNTWKQNKYTLWIEIFLPFLLTVVLVFSLTWIVWVVFDNDKLKEWGKAKYAWPPAAAVITVWTVTKAIMGILKPVSTQIMQCISFPDHTDKLGYQQRVISDISFMKDEIGRRAHCVFIVLFQVLTTFTLLWSLISELRITRSRERATKAPKLASVSCSNLRIIVFVHHLDRCEESVILEVLSAVNLVLAECKISVVIGMDKRLIERAIIKRFGDVNAKANLELADVYIQKIIQLPLDLPDPSAEESKMFLRGQLGVVEDENIATTKDNGSSSNGGGEEDAVEEITAAHYAINMDPSSEITEMGEDQRRYATGKQKTSPYILINEMLFVRYSKGEEDAFLYFQENATGCRRHPREWKCLLNYHRLVWYIFSVSKDIKNFYGWQVELITWIFICWEWQEYMDRIIEMWKEGHLKMNVASSLLMIVEYLIEERDQREKAQGKAVKITMPDDISKITDDFQNSENASSENSGNVTEKKLDALEKSLEELKKEVKQFKEVISDELKKDIQNFKKELSNGLENHIREIKEQMAGKEIGKSEESWETEKKNWERMKKTLKKYDVSMDGVLAFQKFRFYCIAGHLPPIGKENVEENGSI